MKIQANNRPTELPEGSSVAALAEQLALPAQGVAVAVNNRMVPRGGWQEQRLAEGDQVVIIKAACGG